MGTHYTVYIKDDHLGMMISPVTGKSSKPEEEAEWINRRLEESGATVFEPFEFISKASMIVGELRKCHPIHYQEIFNRYDHTYFSDDSRGSHLINLKDY